jgi:molybdenum cofactor biosynthesis enzyme MoaA
MILQSINALLIISLAIYCIYINRKQVAVIEDLERQLSALKVDFENHLIRFSTAKTDLEAFQEKVKKMGCWRDIEIKEGLGGLVDMLKEKLGDRVQVSFGGADELSELIMNKMVPPNLRDVTEFIQLAKKKPVDKIKLNICVKKIDDEGLMPLLKIMTEEQHYEAAQILKEECKVRNI